MNCIVRLKIDLYAPDDILEKSGLCYHAMERTIDLKVVPYPGLNIRIKPSIDDANKNRYSELIKMVANKPGIFEVSRCFVDVDSDRPYDIMAILKGKTEPTLDGFVALKEYMQFFGFKVL